MDSFASPKSSGSFFITSNLLCFLSVAKRFKMLRLPLTVCKYFFFGLWLHVLLSSSFILNVSSSLFIITIVPAVAAFTAAWDWSNSTTAVSCLDNILRQDATRMQRELVNV